VLHCDDVNTVTTTIPCSCTAESCYYNNNTCDADGYTYCCYMLSPCCTMTVNCVCTTNHYCTITTAPAAPLLRYIHSLHMRETTNTLKAETLLCIYYYILPLTLRKHNMFSFPASCFTKLYSVQPF
jgi:hypothetical protein